MLPGAIVAGLLHNDRKLVSKKLQEAEGVPRGMHNGRELLHLAMDHLDGWEVKEKGITGMDTEWIKGMWRKLLHIEEGT